MYPAFLQFECFIWTVIFYQIFTMHLYHLLRFTKTTRDSNTSLTLATQHLKRMKKQGSKHRGIVYILKKIIGKCFNDFNAFKTYQITLSNFSHSSEVGWNTKEKKRTSFIILSLFVFLFACIVCTMLLLLLCFISLLVSIYLYFLSFVLLHFCFNSTLFIYYYSVST